MKLVNLRQFTNELTNNENEIREILSSRIDPEKIDLFNKYSYLFLDKKISKKEAELYKNLNRFYTFEDYLFKNPLLPNSLEGLDIITKIFATELEYFKNKKNKKFIEKFGPSFKSSSQNLFKKKIKIDDNINREVFFKCLELDKNRRTKEERKLSYLDSINEIANKYSKKFINKIANERGKKFSKEEYLEIFKKIQPKYFSKISKSAKIFYEFNDPNYKEVRKNQYNDKLKYYIKKKEKK